jgi:hypothetical protein
VAAAGVAPAALPGSSQLLLGGGVGLVGQGGNNVRGGGEVRGDA